MFGWWTNFFENAYFLFRFFNFKYQEGQRNAGLGMFEEKGVPDSVSHYGL